MEGFSAGFRCFFFGLGFIRKERLWRFVLLPSALSLLLGGLIFWGTYAFLSANVLPGIDALLSRCASFFQIRYEGLPTPLVLLARLLILTTSFIVQLILYRTVASLLVIPFLGPLLSQVERIEIGHTIETSLGTDARNAMRGALVGLRLAFVSVAALILSLFLGPLQFFFNTAVQSYALGRSAFDLVFEKATEDPGERRALVRTHRSAIYGLGLAFFLLMLVPVVGVVLGPAAATVGAALLFHRRHR